MFESFVIMLREGIEAALVIAIILVAIKRTDRRDLERPVWWGIGLAVLASIGAAAALSHLPLSEELYEGTLYFVSTAFVISMMWWMHVKSKTLKKEIEKRVVDTAQSMVSQQSPREAWGLGAFAFLMVFREGVETVMFLGAVNLTTNAVLSFIGTLLGLVLAIIFCVMFVKGSLRVNLGRFFAVTEWVLGIFVTQLLINGYHEFSEAGILPATQKSMALIGPVVRNNSLFIIALIAIPLFIWLTRESKTNAKDINTSDVEKRLAKAKEKSEQVCRLGAVMTALVVLIFVGISYAQEIMPKHISPPEIVTQEGDFVVVPLEKLEDGKLHRLGFFTNGRTVRFLAMKTGGKYRTGLDVCRICGNFGYIQDGENLLCINCAAKIAPSTLGHPGGCNPIPLESIVKENKLFISVKVLEDDANLFKAQSALEVADRVCGMRIKVSEAVAFETINGKTYYFCSQKCRAQFKANPAQFIQSK